MRAYEADPRFMPAVGKIPRVGGPKIRKLRRISSSAYRAYIPISPICPGFGNA